MEHLYNHAAIGYANLWWRQDRLFLKRMKDKDMTAMAATLGDIATAYSVIRGIPDGRRYAGWDDTAKKLLSMKKLTASTYVHAVDQLQSELVKTRKLMSAASKILWFHSKSPVKIFDKRAADALDFKNGSYLDYCGRWSSEFKQSEEAILRSIEKLIQHINCTTIPPAGRDEFYDVVNQKWFAERVFDKYLWEKGGK